MVEYTAIYRELRQHTDFLRGYNPAHDPNFERLDLVHTAVSRRINELWAGSMSSHDEKREWELVEFGVEIEHDISLLRRGSPLPRRERYSLKAINLKD